MSDTDEDDAPVGCGCLIAIIGGLIFWAAVLSPFWIPAVAR